MAAVRRHSQGTTMTYALSFPAAVTWPEYSLISWFRTKQLISSSCHMTRIFTDQLIPQQAAYSQQLSRDRNIHWSADSAPSSLFPAAVTWPEYIQISWFRNKQLISSSCHVTRIFPDQLIPWQAAYFSAAVTWPEYSLVSWFRYKQLISTSCHMTFSPEFPFGAPQMNTNYIHC